MRRCRHVKKETRMSFSLFYSPKMRKFASYSIWRYGDKLPTVEVSLKLMRLLLVFRLKIKHAFYSYGKKIKVQIEREIEKTSSFRIAESSLANLTSKAKQLEKWWSADRVRCYIYMYMAIAGKHYHKHCGWLCLMGPQC